MTLDPGRVTRQVEEEVREARASDPQLNLKAELRRADRGQGRREHYVTQNRDGTTLNGHGHGPPGMLPVNAPHLRRMMRQKVKGHVQNLSSGIQGGGIRQQPRPGQQSQSPSAASLPKTEVALPNSVVQLPSLTVGRAPPSQAGRHGGGQAGHVSNPNPPTWKLMQAPMVKSVEGAWRQGLVGSQSVS